MRNSHVNVSRAKMRMRLAAKGWDSFIENLEQVCFENGDDQEVYALHRELIDKYFKKINGIYNRILKM